MSQFAERLKTLRERTGKSAADIARTVGISDQLYWTMENGKNCKTFEKLPRLARALGCRIDDLFPEMDEPETKETERQVTDKVVPALPAPAVPSAQMQDDDDDWLGFEW